MQKIELQNSYVTGSELYHFLGTPDSYPGDTNVYSFEGFFQDMSLTSYRVRYRIIYDDKRFLPGIWDNQSLKSKWYVSPIIVHNSKTDLWLGPSYVSSS